MKEKITQHSILLFEEKGFVETSVQDIVEALGVTKGTFYYYFTSKEQLLMEIHLGYIDRLLARQQVIVESGDSAREKISGMIRLLIMDIASYGPSARVFFREVRHLGQENAAEIREKRERFRLTIEQVLERGKGAGEFREDMEPGITAFAVLGITNWSYQWYNPAGEISPDHLAAIYTTLILQGIE
ncbi:TetR/AcrR family transcriptional regulator [Planococcus lenghuensis]|uniref:TetR family transcriptional regulator n=1 Tax=Planococcus lenghuensis TaxID=2213202 RepID=A0A1Q2KUS4_9BACL|nr:TetR/AcrR family transcriptional regulator [Planococcus lenghuensis]AQQ51968.1 TetR family transcriptional regulator [Planococcus lenghuensis]